jgi:hypothetical protein
VQQAGATRHQHICAWIESFAAEVMPEFAECEAVYAERKRRELAIEVAFAGKPRLLPMGEVRSRSRPPTYSSNAPA